MALSHSPLSFHPQIRPLPLASPPAPGLENPSVCPVAEPREPVRGKWRRRWRRRAPRTPRSGWPGWSGCTRRWTRRRGGG
uniref:Uncharacterized protein n=1 Tax=Arundo donax TaxID=35708 RepID=A0A0A9HY82_ARUDO